MNVADPNKYDEPLPRCETMKFPRDHSISSLPQSMVSQNGSQKVAWLIWIAHFAFIIRQKIFQRGRLDFDTLDTYAAVDVGIVAILMIILLLSSRTFQVLTKAFKLSVFWMLLYYMVCALSATWSLRPAYSLYRSVEFMVFFVSLVIALSYSSGFEKAERRVLFLSILSVFLQMGLHMRDGIPLSLAAWHTNAYSASAVVIFVYCASEYLASAKQRFAEHRMRRKILFLFGSLSFSLLVLGTSSASNIAALFGLAVILLVQRKVGLVILIVCLTLPFFVLGNGLDLLKEAVFPGKSEQAIDTLGGRTMAWSYYIEKIAASPFLGYGLGVSPIGVEDVLGSGIGGSQSGDDEVGVAYSHNFVISILIGTGFIGFSVFLVFLVKLAAELISTLRCNIKGSLGILAAMAAGFVNSLSMPMIADRWVTASFAFMSIFALFILYVYPRSCQSPHLQSFDKDVINGGTQEQV